MTGWDLHFIDKSRDDWDRAHKWFFGHLRDEMDFSTPQFVLLTNLAIPASCRTMVERLTAEKILAYLPHDVLDKSGTYALIRFGSASLNRMTFLKMKNPSTGQWHLEAVHPNLTTVEQALNWRNQGWFIHADKLT